MPARLSLKVTTGASRNGIVGWLGNYLKLRVTAPPAKGKANKAAIETLAHALNVPKTAIKIVSGSTHPVKTIEVSCLSEKQVYERLKSAGFARKKV
ncbi:MAG: DUF167 domain-containing protein [Pseudomonadales bacterium]|nr:DUF167 domain-containing protein [Pseudomonadales bacterium]